MKKIAGVLLALVLVLIALNISTNVNIVLPEEIIITKSELSKLTINDIKESFELNNTLSVSAGKERLNVKFLNILPVKSVNLKVVEDQYVFPGGIPIGFTLQTRGVIIIGISDVLTDKGYMKPSADSGIVPGDVIIGIAGQTVNSTSDIEEIINSPENRGKALSISVQRKDKIINSTVTPALDSATNKYKLGLWIRDSAAGIGTLTYIKEGDLRFGALGHPISDVDTGTILPVLTGEVFRCNIVGVLKGTKGTPGELKGVFLKGGKKFGTVDKNNKFGVFGNLTEVVTNGISEEPMAVGGRMSVKPGKAKILTTVGNETSEYDIEIVKTNYQKTSDEKSMVIKITDPALLQKTGGIVQGMSGSPIIQNGKIVGAVTHVFVNDPTKGFGVYLDWMLDQ